MNFLLFFIIAVGIAFLLNWYFQPQVKPIEEPLQNIEEEEEPQQPSPPPPLITHVYLDLAKEDYVREPPKKRVIIELFAHVVPLTSNNFAQLCQSKKYVNSPFHRVIRGFMVQGGDVVNGDGTGSVSIYGKQFQDENFTIKHTKAGLLSMANSGPDTNGCQFFILTNPSPHLDGKHVVFGQVIEGMEHVIELENEMTDNNDKPIRRWYVADCGVLSSSTK